jgi:hypothetical protein
MRAGAVRVESTEARGDGMSRSGNIRNAVFARSLTGLFAPPTLDDPLANALSNRLDGLPPIGERPAHKSRRRRG